MSVVQESQYEVILAISDGEDGMAKIWSRTGMLRTILVQTSQFLMMGVSCGRV